MKIKSSKNHPSIGVGAPSIGPQEIKYVVSALKNQQLSCGPLTIKFENLFARHHKRKYAFFCNSGTSALQVAVHALKIKNGWHDGDEVIVPALTFVASVNVILQNNLTPVLVDVEPNYYEINPELIEAKITRKTRAIMPVHLFGQPCDMQPILKLAKKHKLAIIEDSCETMFAHYRGESVGSWGDISCFSTYVAHLLVTGVGGLATTNDPKLALLIKSLFNHGRDGIYIREEDDDRTKLTQTQFKEIVKRRFNFLYPGYSYRATELEGALGLAQIERWQEIIGKHQKNAYYLLKQLASLSRYLQLPQVRANTEHVFMMFPIVVIDKSVSRDKLILYLENNGIETRHMLPIINQPVYKSVWGNKQKDYPHADFINRNGFYVGCHQNLTRQDLDYMVKILTSYFASKS